MILSDLGPIVEHSARRASAAAVSLWAMSSAQYPMVLPTVLDEVVGAMVETASTFAVNARRAMAVIPNSEKYALRTRSVVDGRTEPFTMARVIEGRSAERVTDLLDALHRIVHAVRLDVPFWHVPAEESKIDEGAVMITTVLIETDRKPLAFVDPFSLAVAWFRGPWTYLGGRPVGTE